MLAKKSPSFDSDDYLFEVKWDGARGIALVGVGSYRLFSRRQVDITKCFPELEFLRRLPPGTVLDGEVVVLERGKPDFGLLLSRLGTRGEFKRRVLARTTPATCTEICSSTAAPVNTTSPQVSDKPIWEASQRRSWRPTGSL